MTVDERRLDGNAMAGLLQEVFRVEMTSAMAICAGCGAMNPVARIDVYADAPGMVARCPTCGQVLLRVVHGRGRMWLDPSGIACVELADMDA